MKLTILSVGLHKIPILISGFPEKPPNPRNFGVIKPSADRALLSL
jgi:hypothetical protein